MAVVKRCGMEESDKEVEREVMSLAVVVFVLIVDQVSKLVARGLGKAQLNMGGVLGVLEGSHWILLMGVALGLIFWVRRKRKLSKSEGLGLDIILASGVSNLLDRVVWGGVWDFIYYPILNVVGNVADVLLGVGVIILLVCELKPNKENNAKE